MGGGGDLRQTYRSSVGMAIDVMEAISSKGEDGIRVSVLARIANLSHYACHDRLNVMIERGLVEKTVIPGRTKLSGNKTFEGHTSYKLTSLGHQILKQLKELESICQSYLGLSVVT